MTSHSMELSADGSPRLRTPLPGPRSRELLERQDRFESSARTYPRRLPLALARAHGSYIEDFDGNVFIDFLSGAGVLALGHGHPELVAAVEAQLGGVLHTLDFPTDTRDQFAHALLGMLPDPMRERMKIHFCGPTGADATDAAIKLCKTATGRSHIVSFQGGFHGSTQSTIAMTGLLAPKRALGPLMPGIHFFPYSYCRRCPLALKPDTCSTNCVQYLERVLDDVNGGVPTPAAVIMEVVQGEGGVIPATPTFAREVRRITRERDIPLIVDEIQSGCGRTGRWYGFEHYDIEPDVIVTAKALGGLGMPIALILYDRALDTWGPAAHTGTFRGNQAAFAAGLKLLEIVRRDKLLAHVESEGAYLRERLARETAGMDLVGELRGLGLMLGLELSGTDTRRGPELAVEVQRACLHRGLLLELGGRDDEVIRLLPALNIERKTSRAAADILIDVLGSLAG
ncbi:aspartate aminotransferase family protein [Haliangium ochraceum]|uniref:2,4-diaminobutyrate 4-transaminase n=1 Tax=Haliangium ochraceum (strain DSM 14365 / JCM 11303 / SMP-2) TaxID=502025 RepID=D0LLE3_HALO1|nr:2,4-diaminobutyrate 4-transaminase [Haliangium ochraceum DSM 14365]